MLNSQQLREIAPSKQYRLSLKDLYHDYTNDSAPGSVKTDNNLEICALLADNNKIDYILFNNKYAVAYNNCPVRVISVETDSKTAITPLTQKEITLQDENGDPDFNFVLNSNDVQVACSPLT